jgi:hypothetical protein
MTTKGDPPKPKWHAQDIHDAHALAIGRIAIAWNEFQDHLGELFAILFGQRRYAHALRAWQSLENDRAQRELLRAVALENFGSKQKAP